MDTTKVIITLPVGTKYWWDRTPEQVDNLRSLDAAMGATLDSAGEPKIYNVTTWNTAQEPLTCTVTKTRGVSWQSWLRKPTFLIEVITTINGMPRVIKVRDPRRTRERA